MNQNPELIARDQIDRQLIVREYIVQGKAYINFAACVGLAVDQYQISTRPAYYIIFVDPKLVGILVIKKENGGIQLKSVEEQSLYFGSTIFINELNEEPKA